MPLLICFLLPRVPSQGFILTYQTCRHPQWIHPLNRDRCTDTENRLVVTKEVTTQERGMNWAFGFGRCKLLRTEGIDNKVLLYSTGNYSPSPEINLMEQNIKKKCVCVKRNHLALQQKLTHHCKSATSFNQKSKKKKLPLLFHVHLRCHSLSGSVSWFFQSGPSFRPVNCMPHFLRTSLI